VPEKGNPSRNSSPEKRTFLLPGNTPRKGRKEKNRQNDLATDWHRSTQIKTTALQKG